MVARYRDKIKMKNSRRQKKPSIETNKDNKYYPLKCYS